MQRKSLFTFTRYAIIFLVTILITKLIDDSLAGALAGLGMLCGVIVGIVRAFVFFYHKIQVPRANSNSFVVKDASPMPHAS
ncbi:MAG: hypothetical protein OHK0038_01070 [Flammeovirgaceae bacterium]